MTSTTTERGEWATTQTAKGNEESYSYEIWTRGTRLVKVSVTLPDAWKKANFSIRAESEKTARTAAYAMVGLVAAPEG